MGVSERACELQNGSRTCVPQKTEYATCVASERDWFNLNRGFWWAPNACKLSRLSLRRSGPICSVSVFTSFFPWDLTRGCNGWILEPDPWCVSNRHLTGKKHLSESSRLKNDFHAFPWPDFLGNWPSTFVARRKSEAGHRLWPTALSATIAACQLIQSIQFHMMQPPDPYTTFFQANVTHFGWFRHHFQNSACKISDQLSFYVGQWQINRHQEQQIQWFEHV